jgi:hypothetical protein
MPNLEAKVEPTAKQALFPAHASLKRRSRPYRELGAWLDNEKIAARSLSNRPVVSSSQLLYQMYVPTEPAPNVAVKDLPL